MGKRYNPPPNWPPPPSGWKPGPGWQPDPSWGPPPAGWDLWIDDGSSRRFGAGLKVAGLLGGALVVFAAGVAAGGGDSIEPESAAALSAPGATVTKTAEATVTAEVESTVTATATATVKKKSVRTVTATVTKKASGSGGGSGGGGTDPRFSYCTEAIAAGYGPYVRGVDPEYEWYRDADGDGVVCE